MDGDRVATAAQGESGGGWGGNAILDCFPTLSLEVWHSIHACTVTAAHGSQHRHPLMSNSEGTEAALSLVPLAPRFLFS